MKLDLVSRLGRRRRSAAPDVSATVVAAVAPPERLDLAWDEFAASDAHLHPGYLDRLLSRERDGVTITGVFTPEECAAAVAAMEERSWDEHFIGGIVGMAVGMIWAEEPDRSRYYDDTERSRRIVTEAFGFDPHERLQAVLAPISGGRPLVAPDEDGRHYNPGQFRFWELGRRGLPAHVGNEFRRDLQDNAMKHLLTVTSVKDHLSYFVVVQPPDVGGELSVYDLKWEDDDASGHSRVDVRDDSSFDDAACLRLAPGAGDLILFGGGWRWHRVEPLTGTVQRVTYGGFCAPSVDRREIHFWA